MTHTLCDCCGFNGGCRVVSVPCHIAETSGQGNGYIDERGERVSGRMVDYDLCSKCRNAIYSCVFQSIEHIRVVSNVNNRLAQGDSCKSAGKNS